MANFSFFFFSKIYIIHTLSSYLLIVFPFCLKVYLNLHWVSFVICFFQDILVLLDTHLYILLPLQLNLLPLPTIIILLPHPTSTILFPHSLLSILRLRPTSTILPPSALPLRPSIGGRYHNCLRLFRV